VKARRSESPEKRRNRPQAAQVVTFSWASRREAANHEEQKQETETGSVETKLGLPDLDHAKAAGLDGNIKILSIQESKSRLTPEKWIS